MRDIMLASTVASGLLLAAAAPAGAMTAPPLAPAESGPTITLVSGGCGFGFHRGPFGGCRPNFYHPYYHAYGWHHYGWRHYGWRHW